MAETDSRPSYGHTRGRSKSSFSFKSTKSDSSDQKNSKIKPEDLKETDAARRRAKWATVDNSKDPNRAVNEITPAERAQAESTTLPSLIKDGQMRDWKGEVISDPDASNPTRSRMERPLDTIRSFEAAIDKKYSSNKRLSRTESADAAGQASRRSSFVGGYDPPFHGRQSSYGGYGGYNGPRVYPPPRDARDGYGPRPGIPRHSTTPSGYYHGGPGPESGPYPSHGYHESYDTVNTGESYNTSGSEPWTNSTDPSSENSSMDRIHGGRQDYNDAYGNSYSQPYGRGSPRHDPIQEEYVQDGYADERTYGPPRQRPQPPQPSRASYQQMPPPAPQHQQYPPQQYPPQQMAPPGPPRKPMPAPGVGAGPAPPPHATSRLQRPPPPPKKNSSDDGGKRKSWLRRRFSKG